MPDHIEAQIVNYPQFSGMIQDYIKIFGSAKLPFTAILQQFWEWNRVNIFELQGPGKYEDLSDAYQQWKENVVGFIYPILKLYGVLEASITGADSVYSVAQIYDDHLVMGTNAVTEKGVPYAWYLQMGTSNSPARPFIIKTEEQMDKYARTFFETMDRQISKEVRKT